MGSKGNASSLPNTAERAASQSWAVSSQGEAEAMVESLKTGLSFFVVSNWRGVVDFSGRKPQFGREAVRAAPKTG
jgi:hypothetical protein